MDARAHRRLARIAGLLGVSPTFDKGVHMTREQRMERWKKFKRDYRNAGGRNWKMAKKALKRARIKVRVMKNRLLDNVSLATL